MKIANHFHELPPRSVRPLLARHDHGTHKIKLWNAFVDSQLTGINDDDCHILPRVLPGSYLPVIERSARAITEFALRLLSLPEREVEAIVPSGPIRNFLIHELGVLKARTGRVTGSFRFDMAIVGEPTRNNPPRLLEINEIGFDGLARSSFIQESLFRLIPELSQHLFALDTAAAEARNMRRAGSTIARFQDDSYNWEEEVLIRKAREQGVEIRLVSPREFGFKGDRELPLLSRQDIGIENGRVRVGRDFYPDLLQMGYSFRYQDYLEAKELYRRIAQSKTPQYGSFLTGLVASKMILVLLNDLTLRRKLLGSTSALKDVILPATALPGQRAQAERQSQNLVLKQVDGLGGEMVFIGSDVRKQLRKIQEAEENHWVLQKRIALNTLDVRGILSRPRKVISDLGVFVHYDWQKGRLAHFEVGGFITRATNHSYKVNVSGGGIQVPVMFTRKR